MKEVRVVACNYAVATKIASKGALCYVLLDNPGWGNNRIVILARSRGGRWVNQWERIDRLTNFRRKTVVDADPIYDRVKDCGHYNPLVFQFAELRDRIARLANMRPSWPGCGFEQKGTPRG